MPLHLSRQMVMVAWPRQWQWLWDGDTYLDSRHNLELKPQVLLMEREEEVEELGMTVRFGALSSPAKRNHQASFGHRQMVRLGGNSGPPSLPEMSPHFVASQIPPAADNM